MVKLCEINQTATFAWSHDSLPLMATGTLAGVMDDTFSSDSVLQIYDVFSSTQGNSKPLYSGAANAKYNSIAWSGASKDHSRGILAAGLENSTIELYDPEAVLKSTAKTVPVLETYKKHTTAVLQVQFNALQQHILASSGSNGEIYVWDTNKGTCFSPGRAMSPAGKVSCLSWNNTVSHIFASAGDTGYASIWDLKAKREVLQLSYSGVNLSVVDWHPNQSTRIVTASGSDLDPVILTWDLRNSSTPEKILKGHRKAILSLDWCKSDPELLLSSGKDDVAMLWNPLSGEKLAEYPSLPNWANETRFSPRIPDVFASASLGKKIVVQSLQDTSPPVAAKVGSTAANEDEFWTQISTADTQQPVFEKHQAPLWFKRPVSAVFGYGGKLSVVLRGKDASEVKVVSVPEVLKSISSTAECLKKAVESSDFRAVCAEKVSSEENGEIAGAKDWELLSKLVENGRKKLLEEKVEEKALQSAGKSEKTDAKEAPDSSENSDEDFFEQLQSAKQAEAAVYTPTGEFAISQVGSKEDRGESEGKDQSEGKLTFDDKAIVGLLKGDIEGTLDLCITDNRIIEALVLALDGTEEMKAKAKSAYFTKFAKGNPLARILYSATSKDVSDIVRNADISSWKLIARSILAYDGSDGEKFNSHVTLLGTRLAEAGSRAASADKPALRDSALLCFAAGGALDKVSEIWLSELEDIEKFYEEKSDEAAKKKLSASDIRFKALSEVVEKIIVYENAAKLKDDASFKHLPALGNALREYSSFLAGAGEFALARKTLDLAPEDTPGIELEKKRLAVALGVRDVQKHTLQSPFTAPKTALYGHASSPAPLGTRKTHAARGPAAAKYVMPSYPGANGVPASVAPVAPAPNHNAYAPRAAPISTAAAPVNPGVGGIAATNPYAPSAAPSAANGGRYGAGILNQRPPSVVAPSYQTAPIPAPPPTFGAVSTATPPLTRGMAPPSANRNAGGWNDLPESIGGKSLKRTASSAAVPSVYQRALSNHNAQPQSAVPSPYAPPNRQQLTHNNASLPPPPPPMVAGNTTLSSRSGSISSGAAPQKQKQSAARNPYAPVPAPPAVTATAGAAKNPYGPIRSPPQTSAPFNPYAPPTAAFGASPGMPNFSRRASSVASYGSGAAEVVPPPPRMIRKKAEPSATPAPPHKMAPAADVTQSVPLQQPQPQAPPAQTSVAVQGSAQTGSAGQRGNSESIESIVANFSHELEKVKPKIPEKFHKQLADCEKRLSILYKKLEESSIDEQTVELLLKLSTALSTADFDEALSLKADLKAQNVAEYKVWLVGVERLIGMGRATN